MTREIEERKLNQIPQNKSTQVLNCWIALSDNRLDLYSLLTVLSQQTKKKKKNRNLISYFFQPLNFVTLLSFGPFAFLKISCREVFQIDSRTNNFIAIFFLLYSIHVTKYAPMNHKSNQKNERTCCEVNILWRDKDLG